VIIILFLDQKTFCDDNPYPLKTAAVDGQQEKQVEGREGRGRGVGESNPQRLIRLG